MNLSTGTPIPQLPTGTIDSINSVIPVTTNMTGTPVTIQSTIGQISQVMAQSGYLTGSFQTMRGYISENGAILTYGTGTFYKVEAGAADVNGTLLTWSSPINRSGITLTSGSIHYSYLYNNGGNAAVEESTTAPVWDSERNYFKKTGDNTRRCIGAVQASSINTIRPFVTIAKGRVMELWYIDGDVAGGGAKVPINSSNSFATGTVWGSVDCSTVVPIHTQEVLIVAKLILAVTDYEGILGLSPWDMGTSQANQAPYQARARSSSSAGNVFFGNVWIQMKAQQIIYYKLQTQAGNPRAQIEIHGYRIIR